MTEQKSEMMTNDEYASLERERFVLEAKEMFGEDHSKRLKEIYALTGRDENGEDIE